MSSDKRNASGKQQKPIENPDDDLEAVVKFDKSGWSAYAQNVAKGTL